MVRTIADPVHHRAGQRAAADMDVVRAAVVAPFGAVAHRSRLGDEGVRARIEPDGFPYANSVDAIRPADVAAVDRQAPARLVDRESVVVGKGGAVRVDLGGLRLNKK